MASAKRTILTWALALLSAAAFLSAGISKIVGVEEIVTMLNGTLGVPLWAIPLIGAVHVVGAVLVLVPPTRFIGAAILLTTMVGAVGTHLLAGDVAGSPAAIALTLLTGALAWLVRDEAPWMRRGGEAIVKGGGAF